MSQLNLQKSHHVTAVISHRVKAGRQQGYEEWIRGIAAAAREFQGHLGVSILRPQPDSTPLDYAIVLQFDTCQHLTSWLGSGTRNEWIERVQPLIQEPENIQILTGLESWFQLPKQPRPRAPQQHKQAILVWVGVMAISLVIAPAIQPLLEPLPHLVALAINVAITVALLTYLIMPVLTRWFKDWLFAT